MTRVSLAQALRRAGLVGKGHNARPLPFWLPQAIEFMVVKNGVGAACPDDVLIGRLIDRSIAAGLSCMVS